MSSFCLNGGGGHAIRLSCSALQAGQIDEGVLRLAALVSGARW
jgi:DNA-binding transcriptional MocR family regulator